MSKALRYQEYAQEVERRKSQGEKVIYPQEGPQTRFLQTNADICIYGGAAGGGKTYGLLLTALRHISVPGFGYTIFRKNYKQIFNQGGLWDEAAMVYGGLPGAHRKITDGSWLFDGERGVLSKVTFAHIERDSDLESYQGSQLCGIGFDELTHFSEYTFFYMLSRNRSTCGVKPFVRGTCNPDPDSWVAKFIAWWINQDTGYPIPERSGVKRWFIRRNETLHWADSRRELWEKFDLKTEEELQEPKSVTFIMSSVYDNKELLRIDPGYLANLKAMAEVERERLLKGNWKIKPIAGLFFKRVQIGTLLDEAPDDLETVCRGWDLAATDRTENEDAAFTAGVLMGRRKNGRFVILDVINQQLQAGDVRKLVLQTARMDREKYGWVRQRIPQDPGQAGKEQALSYISMLAGYDVKTVQETGGKTTRAEPMAAQWQAGNFDVVAAPWNEVYFNQLESFPDSKWKDMVDAGSSAFNELTLGMAFNINNLL